MYISTIHYYDSTMGLSHQLFGMDLERNAVAPNASRSMFGIPEGNRILRSRHSLDPLPTNLIIFNALNVIQYVIQYH